MYIVGIKTAHINLELFFNSKIWFTLRFVYSLRHCRVAHFQNIFFCDVKISLMIIIIIIHLALLLSAVKVAFTTTDK